MDFSGMKAEDVFAIKFLIIELLLGGGVGTWLVFKTTSGIPDIIKPKLQQLVTLLIIASIVGAILSAIVMFVPIGEGFGGMGWVSVYNAGGEKDAGRLFRLLFVIPILMSYVGAVGRWIVGTREFERI